MDYFGDQYTNIGNQGVFSLKTIFPSIEDKPIEIPARERTYRKDEVVQQNNIEGQNKAITFKDQDGKTRLFIGFKEGVF